MLPFAWARKAFMSVVALNAVAAVVVVGSVILAVSTVAAENDDLSAVALCSNIL